MRGLKRLIYYLLLNVLVSAAVTLLVLRWWESRSLPAPAPGTAVVIRVTVAPQDTLPVAEAVLPEAPALPTTQPAPQPLQPTATIEVFTYLVQVGDTLGTIAASFDVLVADLLVVNQIDDPDQLYVGQIIYIPTGPLPTSAPAFTVTQPATASPTSTLQPTVGPLPTATLTTIWEPPAIHIVTVIGAGDVTSERVVLERTGSGELPLAGWRLEDQDGHVYRFPQLTLYPDGAVNVYSRLGQNTVVDLYWGLTAPVWASGETVTLIDAQGIVHTSFTIP